MNPITIIQKKDFLIDNFEKCNETNNYSLPEKYYVKSSGKIIVKLQTYNKTVMNYNLKPMIFYDIGLTNYYNKTDGSCDILIVNENDYPVIIKRKYEYPSFLKYLIYVSLKAEEYSSYNNWD